MNSSLMADDYSAVETPVLMKGFLDKAALYHGRFPVIRKLPLPVVGIILTVGIVNIMVWVGVGVVLVSRRHCYVVLVTSTYRFSA